MSGWIDWWCHLIGITDAGAIQIAAGIVAGGSALFIGYLAVMVVLMIVGAIGNAIGRA